jgi:hypothetical protein
MDHALGKTPRLGMIGNRGYGKYFKVKSRSTLPRSISITPINFNYNECEAPAVAQMRTGLPIAARPVSISGPITAPGSNPWGPTRRKLR